MQRLKQIKSFIDMVLQVQQNFEDHFRTNQDVYFFNLNPRFVRIQQDLQTEALNIGIISITKDEHNKIGNVLLTKEAFYAITTKDQQQPWYVDTTNENWLTEHYRVTIDGIEMWNVDCRQKEQTCP
ncbi:hypothetical protein V2H29_21645 [Lysinibacillus fusiformis]|uniref:hypothetical protein n=1 Tax=Lysinibacillus fusiformis TaxID=28031 RepID=UPI002EA66EF1|nr:hypothetical protein [Lysinibacillus fusiformis]